MTSLPISHHKPQSSASAASALPGNAPADSLATDTQSADPFAFLLAQQIGATDLSALEAATLDGNTADGNTDLPLLDAQGLAATKPDDPTGIVAAILQQLPIAEDKGQQIALQQTAESFAINALDKIDDSQAIPTLAVNPLQKTDDPQAIPTLAVNPLQKTDDSQAIPTFAVNSPQSADGSQATRGASPESGRSSLAAALAGDQTMKNPAIDNLSSAAFNRAELASGQTQPAQSGTQALVQPSGYANMPGTLANNVAPVTPTVTTPLGHQGWANDFSQKISWVASQQNQIAQLHLNPPNLGPLDVVLKISGGEATALFASPHGAVREAIESALPKLREILADNGIMLGNTTISDQTPRDRNMDQFMGQDFNKAAQREIDDTASGSVGLSSTTEPVAPVRRHNGMVDTFA
ncbi:MAG: flagellar hook-length control protein FliK [Gallionella sp.]|nr:flagellar hook-length control protein FliK [Gallionella sp.]